MTITDNKDYAGKIGKFLDDKLPVRLGVNKRNELVRLMYEISLSKDVSIEDIAMEIRLDGLIEEGKNRLFHRVKDALIHMRYPSITPGEDPHIMPLKLGAASRECTTWDFKLHPKRIFIENSVKDLKWTKDIISSLPDADIREINNAANGLSLLEKKAPLTLYNERNDNLFIVKSKSAFIKVCPCTKGYKRCGYWILNLGFGCPIDCSYCYLQMYSNAPGMVLSANIEDYYKPGMKFDKKVRKRTRIGTGEFTDSLAFDNYTRYSSYLVPLFRDTKNLVLELKTKVSDIDNVLKEEPHQNVVISWSINTPEIAKKYEKGASSVDERISAAVRAAGKGYKVGFHFDPLVFHKKWEDDYKAVVEEMFSFDEIRRNTAWISLGTLRYTPGLKQTAEQRFTENLMFYQGEFFMDTDGKLRYPRRLRINMYNKIIRWIRSFNTSCWIYLCMEPEELWRKTDLKRSDYSFS